MELVGDSSHLQKNDDCYNPQHVMSHRGDILRRFSLRLYYIAHVAVDLQCWPWTLHACKAVM